MKRNPDINLLLHQKGMTKSDELHVSLSSFMLVCPGQDAEISHGTLTASPCKFWCLPYWAASTHGEGIALYSRAQGEIL